MITLQHVKNIDKISFISHNIVQLAGNKQILTVPINQMNKLIPSQRVKTSNYIRIYE